MALLASAAIWFGRLRSFARAGRLLVIPTVVRVLAGVVIAGRARVAGARIGVAGMGTVPVDVVTGRPERVIYKVY
jgi:hypothetical protein